MVVTSYVPPPAYVALAFTAPPGIMFAVHALGGVVSSEFRCVRALSAGTVSAGNNSVDGDGSGTGDGAVGMEREDQRLRPGVDDEGGAIAP